MLCFGPLEGSDVPACKVKVFLEPWISQQGDHLPGRPGKIRDFKEGLENVRELKKSDGKVTRLQRVSGKISGNFVGSFAVYQ